MIADEPQESGHDPRPIHRLVAAVSIVAVLGFGALVVRSYVWFPIGLRNAGSHIGNTGFAVQLAAMLAGIAAVHIVPRSQVRAILILEGLVCLLAHGLFGVVYAAALLAWYGAVTAPLGRARWLVLLALVVGFEATAFGALSTTAFVFSVMFALRLVMFTWDRWQHDFARVPLVDFAVYMLVAPLVAVPPYVTIIPIFEGFSTRIDPQLTAARLRAIGRHLALALVFGALRGGMTLLAPPSALAVPWGFVINVLDFAVLAHVLVSLLLLHGIEDRLPLISPLRSTRYIELWNRFRVHQKDVQVRLFFTPALLRFRRANRYVALICATAWTMLVGNALLHVIAAYFFYWAKHPDPWSRIAPVIWGNLLMTIALATDLCMDELVRRHPNRWRIPRWLGIGLGWSATMTIAAIIASI